jgi:hypothetical protein
LPWRTGADGPGLDRAGDHVAKCGEEDVISAALSHSRSSFVAPAHPGRFEGLALSLRPLAPGIGKAAVGGFCLRDEGPLGVAHGLDAVVLRPSRDVSIRLALAARCAR